MFEMLVEDIFHITGLGTVFLGKILSGSVSIGDPIICKTPTMEKNLRVIGLQDQKGGSLKNAEAGATVGVICKKIDISSTDGSSAGTGVTLVAGQKKSWWQF